MTTQAITINLPEELYNQLKRRAEQMHRSLEDELLEVVASALPQDDKIPDELEQLLASLQYLDDTALWKAAETRLPVRLSRRLENLHFKRSAEGLSEAEQQTVKRLLRQADRVMLVRAHAAVLLKERGYDISVLLKKPKP